MSNKLENYIQNNIGQLERKKPDPAILQRILVEMKSKESIVSEHRNVRLLIALKWAAACVIFIICFLGVMYFGRQAPAKVISKVNIIPGKEPLRQPPNNPVVRSTLRSTGKEEPIFTNALINRAKAKNIVWYSGLNNMESAAARIDAIFSVSSATGNSNAVVDTLMRVLNNDPNASVRLAAIDGLKKFYGDGYAGKELTASLKSQLDPVVQINLIALLVQKRELGVLPDLTRMVNDEKLEKSVKDVAYSGILQLQPEIAN